MKTPTILVTGGAGFVALHIAEIAEQAGIGIRLADIHPAKWNIKRWAPKAEFHVADIMNQDRMQSLSVGCSAVIHCAALVGPKLCREKPVDAVKINISGTQNMLEIARAMETRLINVSTATLYGHRPSLGLLREHEPADPISVYDATKLMAETLCNAYRKTYSVDATSVRTGFVYGHCSNIGDYYVSAALRGEIVKRQYGADHYCDFTYVVDLARGLLTTALAPELREPVYNMTGGVLHSRQEFADAVRTSIPEAQIHLGAGVDPNMHLRGACDISLAQRDFGYSPSFDIISGVADWVARERTP